MADTSGLQSYLTLLYAARAAILTGKSYSIGGKTLSRVDERWLSDQIAETEARISRRSGGRTHVEQRFVPNR